MGFQCMCDIVLSVIMPSLPYAILLICLMHHLYAWCIIYMHDALFACLKHFLYVWCIFVCVIHYFYAWAIIYMYVALIIYPEYNSWSLMIHFLACWMDCLLFLIHYLANWMHCLSFLTEYLSCFVIKIWFIICLGNYKWHKFLKHWKK